MIALPGESPKPGATELRNGSEAVVRNLRSFAHETTGDSGVTGIVTGALVPAPTGGDHDSTGDFPACESDLRCSVVVRGLGGYARVPRMYGWRDRPFTNIGWTMGAGQQGWGFRTASRCSGASLRGESGRRVAGRHVGQDLAQSGFERDSQCLFRISLSVATQKNR